MSRPFPSLPSRSVPQGAPSIELSFLQQIPAQPPSLLPRGRPMAAAGVGRVLVVATVICCALVLWLNRRPAEDLRLSGPHPRVAIRAAANRLLLQVGRSDQLVRASGRGAAPAQPARFRLVTLSREAVGELRILAAQREARLAALRQRRTRSGCSCSGYSSEYGFGRFCHSWESEFEEAWCYVGDDCAGGRSKRGSFGRKHETCELAPPPSPPPLPPSPPPPPSPPSPPPSPPPPPESAYSKHFRDEQARWAHRYAWVPPVGCTCSGYSNEHGFGAQCAAWEAKLKHDQTPWCYVDDACPAGKAGSFGHKHADCVPAQKSSFFGMPLGRRRLREIEEKAAVYSRSRRERKFARLAAAKRAAEALEKQVQRYVMFVSEETGGFLTAELPPANRALLLRANSARISLAGVFALLPRGRILSMATGSLLNLCDSVPVAGSEGSSLVVCAGYKESESAPHYRLLRGGAAVSLNTTAFALEWLPDHGEAS